jgi:DNA-directed RNA polymerase beta subunit
MPQILGTNKLTDGFDYSVDTDDLFLVFDSLIDQKGLVDHHIESCNSLYSIGIPQIIEHVFSINMSLYDIKRITPEEKNIDHLDVLINFSNVVIDKPSMLNYNSGKSEILFPNVALTKEKTYKSTLRVDVTIKVTAVMKNGYTIVKEDVVKNFTICKMPIMVKSKWCNTHALSKEALVNLHEDPSDPGGYFIIRGVEWTIDCVENILFNKVRIFRNEGYKKEIMRAEFIAKPGDFYLNSDQFIVRWLNDGQITVEIRREKLKDIRIPFYLIFRMMGWTTDKQIFDNVLFGYDTPTSKNMIQYLVNAFDAKYINMAASRYIYSQNDSLQYVAEQIKDTAFSYLDLDNNPDNYQKVTNFLLENFDTHFLQHMGTNLASREKKLRFLCVIFRKMFLVNLGNMEVTDRDSYNSKRIHAAGTSYAKSFKTNFNASIVQHIRRKITKDLKALSFNQIDLHVAIKSSVFGADFERAITQSITAGNKSQVTTSNRVRINRLSSQLLNRKNQLNVFSTLRQVTATTSDSAKQSERASEMRRVHMSFLGYICVTHSPEGEKVGVNKQLAIFALITKASFSEVIKDILSDDPEIFQLNSVDWKDIEVKKLCNVYVNGDWIGCCADALHIAKKYRQKRREFVINPEITIVWDNTQDEVYFWTDVGRVIRPLLIVYNNQRDKQFMASDTGKKNKSEFIQGLAVTQKHIDKLYAKKIDFEGLLRENIIEYISAEEQENMYLSPDFDTLKQNKNNILCEYTHCDIPQSMFGVTALTSPFADHNQAQRIVYQTSQSKQTCGLFAKNWPYRADKDTFLQYNNETPVVKTVSNKYLYPNGSNCIVAIMCNTGFNIEDSVVINQGAIDRGLFNGCKFTFYKTEIEQREEFANPDITNTTDIKSACYDKLVNGIIKVGTIIHKNDAIIGKIMKITKNADDNFQNADRSIIYKEEEPAIVFSVIVDRNEEDERFCKVVVRKLRSVANGDKFSSRAGQKSTIGLALRDSDMPSTIDGIKPSIIINPHGIPSRMTIGQLLESQVATLCTAKSSTLDATIFKKIDIESVATELENLGLDRYGYRRMYNGITGEYIDCEIFIGPTYYQRLQKFTIDTIYSVSSGPSDAITYQPLDGKSSGGGLRIGEMERDCLVSHGSARFISEKYFAHSDGYTEYVCRCGKSAVVNIGKGIYQCNYCKANASIVAYPTSWSSKLFIQELETLGVGIKRLPQPYTYDKSDDKICELIEEGRGN